MPAVITRAMNELSLLAISNACLNCRLFTVSVNSSTKPGGMATPIRRSIARRTINATRPIETSNNMGPNTMPADLTMCQNRLGVRPFPRRRLFPRSSRGLRRRLLPWA